MTSYLQCDLRRHLRCKALGTGIYGPVQNEWHYIEDLLHTRRAWRVDTVCECIIATPVPSSGASFSTPSPAIQCELHTYRAVFSTLSLISSAR